MPNYDINYDDKRFTEVEKDKDESLSELEKTYGGMIEESDSFYNAQIDASKQWAETQAKNQQEQTDFAIEQIEQQKKQAQKDYTKEQSGAYVDWQKQSNQYGANAEAMAARGMTNTGYSESSQVSMYNTYQNRVATAREAFSRAVLNYDNAIKDARLQNNAKLAEIAYEALQKQLELSLQGFQYKNQLILAKAEEKRKIDDTYYSRYQDVLKQINAENELAEKVRQHNESMALRKESLQLEKDKFAYEKAQAEKAAAAARWKARSSAAVGGAASKAKSNSNKGVVGGAVTTKTKTETKTTDTKDAYAYLNALISSGATKDKVANEISMALRNGAITKEQAAKLRSTFTPRGYTY